MNLPRTSPHPLDVQFEHLRVCRLEDSPLVSVVQLDRPRKRNAINAKMWREIGEVFCLIGSLGDGCRCVLLVGNGKAFTAGIDVSDSSFVQPQDIDDTARRGISFRPQIVEMQQCFTNVEKCPVPVVAAIHGSCIGAGVDLACCADIRVCSPDATFSIREVKLGLAADVGTLQRLPKIVGHGSRVRELCLTGADFDAQEASRLGFVSRVSGTDRDLVSSALTICRHIVYSSPVAVSGTKLSLNFSRDHSVAEGLEHIATHNTVALMTDDLASSFASGLSGEIPVYGVMPPHSRL